MDRHIKTVGYRHKGLTPLTTITNTLTVCHSVTNLNAVYINSIEVRYAQTPQSPYRH